MAGGFPVATALNKNVKNKALLVVGAPEPVLLAGATIAKRVAEEDAPKGSPSVMRTVEIWGMPGSGAPPLSKFEALAWSSFADADATPNN